jgi:hypothetical protein
MTAMRAALLLLVLWLAACGSGPAAALSTPSRSAASSSRSGDPTPPGSASQPRVVPPITNSPIPTANGWVTYVNHVGKFTFSAPAAWRVKSCESEIGYLFATDDTSDACGRQEHYGAWLFGVSLAGDASDHLPPAANEYTYLSRVTGSQAVVIRGAVKGVRYTAVEDRDGMIGAPKGTTEVYYLLFDGQQTLAIIYSRVPKAPDRTSDFDRMVTTTLRLGAS